ncbi:hypothetical protein [Micromonospora rosaria]|uniref:hypothetical protein n=1 Tax=Micromonospora rosaria TaxID=47874 RepID=UPI000AF9B87A|nr:hypothetical protein [Micromonospora rosaria]
MGAVLVAAALIRDRGPAPDRTVGEVTRVGVADGGSIPDYLRAAATELAALPAAAEPGTWALVSFTGYLPPDRLAEVLGDVGVSLVVGRVPLPGRQTELVRMTAMRLPDDVAAAMTEVAARKEREAADQRARSAALTDADPDRAHLRRVYDSGAQVADAEARAYRAGCACVHAAVVRAVPAALRDLATRAGVRAVDPAPEVSRLDRTVFTPPLPEQRDLARPPADDLLGPLSPSVGPS